jgi:hypothetical protein
VPHDLCAVGSGGSAAPALQALEQHWPETSCYADLWIELLQGLRLEPLAAFGFTVGQDYEGDQFTFVKPRAADIQTLYGLSVQELTIYDTLEAHLLEQTRRGRVVLAEVDSFWLPDTAGTAYRHQHGKTTIAVQWLDAGARRLRYIHNRGSHELAGADYDGLLAPTTLPPYVEIVKVTSLPLTARELRPAARRLLHRHARTAPADNPVALFRADIDRHVADLRERGLDYFHLLAFNLPRQLGANFGLLGAHLRWLGEREFGDIADACDAIAGTAKLLQFHLARCAGRNRAAAIVPVLDRLVEAYDAVRDGVRERIEDATAPRTFTAV